MDLSEVDTLGILPEALYYAGCRGFVFGVPLFYHCFFVQASVETRIQVYYNIIFPLHFPYKQEAYPEEIALHLIHQ